MVDGVGLLRAVAFVIEKCLRKGVVSVKRERKGDTSEHDNSEY